MNCVFGGQTLWQLKRMPALRPVVVATSLSKEPGISVEAKLFHMRIDA